MIGDDFRQSQGFRKLLSENGAQIIELGYGEAGFSLPSRPLFILNTLIIPRVYNPEIVSVVEKLPYKHRSLFISVAPKATIDSENAAAWLSFKEISASFPEERFCRLWLSER